MIDNVYSAEKGQGSYLDGKKMQVNKEADIRQATICNNYGYEMHFNEEIKVLDGLYSKDAKRVMTNWSPTFDFCMLASGRVEGIINNGSELHDFAAGKLIAREAGAIITDFSGGPETSDKNPLFLASNGTAIHKYLVEVMSKA
jgi:myo-inositol-1(or 4)-monophosphatase